jgi:hypothetical protein
MGAVSPHNIAAVQAGIDLVRTLIESGRLRYSLGFVDAAGYSVRRAQKTLDSARHGLSRIDIGESRTLLENTLDELQSDLLNLVIQDPSAQL